MKKYRKKNGNWKKTDHHQKITDQVIKMLETAGTDWEKPWMSAPTNPENPCTGRKYSGMNLFLLGFSEYQSPYWAGYGQWQQIGCQVNKNDTGTPTGTPIVKYTTYKVKDKDRDGKEIEKSIPYLKTLIVHNAEQVTGFTPKENLREKLTESEKVGAAEDYFQNLDPSTSWNGDRACYYPSTDCIDMPEFADFTDGNKYYSVLYHEVVHWTGHKSRCDRMLQGGRASESYAFEELIAELGSIFICTELGLITSPDPNNAKYLNSWLAMLKEDKKAIFRAQSKAQDAHKYCQTKQEKSTEKEQVA